MRGRRQRCGHGAGERTPELHRRRPIAERGGVAVDVVQLAGLERGNERGRELGDRLVAHRPRFGNRITRGRVFGREPLDLGAGGVSPVGPHVTEQTPAGQQFQRRVQHERVGGCLLRHRQRGRDRDGRVGSRRRHGRHGRT